jgi:hypothetical protein
MTTTVTKSNEKKKRPSTLSSYSSLSLTKPAILVFLIVVAIGLLFTAAATLSLSPSHLAMAQATTTTQDNTPPTVIVPDHMTVESNTPTGTTVIYTVTAVDNVDGRATLDERGTLTQDNVNGNITIACDLPSGRAILSVGVSKVDCTATDAAGNAGVGSFIVGVTPHPSAGTTPPTVTVPNNMVVNAFSPETTAYVEYTVSATDDLDGTTVCYASGRCIIYGSTEEQYVDIQCNPRTGSQFPIGTTTVQCSAYDSAGNRGTASFTVTVNPFTPIGDTPPIAEEGQQLAGENTTTTTAADTTPPTLTVPNNIVVETTDDPADGTGGSDVTYSVRAVDNVDGEAVLEESDIITQDNINGSITIICDPPSGSMFPIGTTTVQCNAIDAAGNSGTAAAASAASFTITVRAEPDAQAQEPLAAEEGQEEEGQEEGQEEDDDDTAADGEQQLPPAEEVPQATPDVLPGEAP